MTKNKRINIASTIYRSLICIMICELAATTITASEPTTKEQIKRFSIIELTLTSDSMPANPFTDIKIAAEFSGPNGKKIYVDGFYFNDNIWMVRFAPRIIGSWSYTAKLSGAELLKEISGNFDCITSDKHGFLRISTTNAYRLEYEDGTPFYPIGQQIGWGVHPMVGFDATVNKPTNKVDRITFMNAFDDVTNLIRSQLGCGTKAGVALPIITDKENLDRYDLENCQLIDDSCKIIKQYGWAQILIFFQDMSLWGDCNTSFGMVRDTKSYKNINNKDMHHIENYMQYVIARWGAYVDIWELFNEDSYSPSDFLAHLAKVIQKADPYNHLITTNYERPTETWCDIVNVHEYMGIPTKDTPGHLSKEFARLKSYGKPVLYTEFGNQKPLGNVDPVKWRVAAWTAFMNECGLTFWNTSKTIIPDTPTWGGNPNAYLGKESRRYFRTLAQFSKKLPVTMRPIPVMTDHQEVHLWALGNSEKIVLYMHNYTDHNISIKPDDIIIGTEPGTFSVEWINPATGKIIKKDSVRSKGNNTWLKVPSFKIDLAARLTIEP